MSSKLNITKTKEMAVLKDLFQMTAVCRIQPLAHPKNHTICCTKIRTKLIFIRENFVQVQYVRDIMEELSENIYRLILSHIL